MRNVVTNGRMSKTRIITVSTTNGFEVYRAEGVKDILDALSEKVEQINGVEAKAVFVEAAQTVAKAIRAAAPQPSEATRRKGWQSIRDSVFIAAGPITKPNALVGVSRAKAPQALWMEYGTEPRYTKKTKKFTGQESPRPFFRPAINSIRDSVAQQIGYGLKNLLASILS